MNTLKGNISHMGTNSSPSLLVERRQILSVVGIIPLGGIFICQNEVQ